jgi:hypothetical protein
MSVVSYTINKYQITISLCYTYAVTNYRGSCNLEQSLNNNRSNGLHSIYYHHTPQSTHSHKTGAMHLRCTRKKFQRTKSLLSIHAYTNHTDSCNLEQECLNNNWWNGLHCIYSHNLQNTDAHTTMSLLTTEGWLGNIINCNWYLDSLSISHFTTSASNTEFWQRTMSDLI